MDDAVEPSQRPDHRHREGGSHERLWLPKAHDEAASMEPHPFCLECGTVRDLGLPKARPLGFYLSGVAALKAYLERSNAYARLVQVQSHLIAKRLAERPEFEDPYGTPGQAQLAAYVAIVQSIRPDLDEELILRLLPGKRRPPARGRPEGDAAPRS